MYEVRLINVLGEDIGRSFEMPNLYPTAVAARQAIADYERRWGRAIAYRVQLVREPGSVCPTCGGIGRIEPL